MTERYQCEGTEQTGVIQKDNTTSMNHKIPVIGNTQWNHNPNRTLVKNKIFAGRR